MIGGQSMYDSSIKAGHVIGGPLQGVFEPGTSIQGAVHVTNVKDSSPFANISVK